MTKQPLFAVIQLSRVDQFSVSTMLRDDGQHKYFIKTPNTAASKSHLAAMPKTHQILSAIKPLANKVSIVPAKKTDDGGISLPYIKGNGVERLLFMAILEGCHNDATVIINRLLEIIDALPSSKKKASDDEAYKQVFGNSYNKVVDCVEPGLVDLNLDNLIQDDNGRWHLIDYEWAFPFAVPKQLVVQRFFYWFFVRRYQDMLRYHAKRIPQIMIAPNVAIPDYIWGTYSWAFRGMNKTIAAESQFQSYVTGAAPLDELDFYAETDMDTGTLQSAPTTKGYVTTSIEHTKTLQSDLQDSLQQVSRLEEELHNIQASRTYRVASKLAKAKRAITKKPKETDS